MNEDEKVIWKYLISYFKPPENYGVDSYYGVSIMKMKKNNKFNLRLLYDYKKNSIMSKNSFECGTLKEAYELGTLLEKRAKDGSDKDKDDSANQIREAMSKLNK